VTAAANSGSEESDYSKESVAPLQQMIHVRRIVNAFNLCFHCHATSKLRFFCDFIQAQRYMMHSIKSFAFKTKNYCDILEQIFCWQMFTIFNIPLLQ
jgi:hypothetical protein